MIGTSRQSDLAADIRDAAYPLSGADADYDPLMEMAGDARFVLIGEASHGTHEFYSERARITKRLITEKGFTAVAVEADWPDAYRINRYVRGMSDGATAIEALSGFTRFPMWMWRNADVLDFIGWLRDHNDNLPEGTQAAGFYGLDLYSLNASIEAVLNYLDKVDPEAARRARFRYGCFEDFGEDTQAYGYAANFGLAQPCSDEVVNQLIELQKRAGEYANRDGQVADDEFFYAEQNALLVKSAEEYYRTMFDSRVSSWNLRDRHMADTLNSLVAHLERQGGKAKVVIWAHNSHLGDARATQMGEVGELNIGQLVREKYGREVVLVGFSTYTGTVTAASDWGDPPERKRVRPGMPGSYEELFHDVGLPRFMVLLRDSSDIAHALRQPRLQRAIGVIYRPQTERLSHYFQARLSDQFDVMIHIDETRALEPLDRNATWEQGEVPETFPTGQ
ncbi:MAG TPA: erythromycin esterase family protein [Chloroflexia bacterium]|nr:erythromycin esterase family protein [Chloroflexia bacterium]